LTFNIDRERIKRDEAFDPTPLCRPGRRIAVFCVEMTPQREAQMEGERGGERRERDLERVGEIVSGISTGIPTEIGKTDRWSPKRIESTARQ
jgi:hypothetical protein